MNVNVLPIDVLIATPAHPARTGHNRGADKTDSGHGTNDLVSTTESNNIDKSAVQIQTMSKARRGHTPQASYNSAIPAKSVEKGQFEGILKRKLREDILPAEKGQEKQKKPVLSAKIEQNQANLCISIENPAPISKSKPAQGQNIPAAEAQVLINKGVTTAYSQKSEPKPAQTKTGIQQGQEQLAVTAESLKTQTRQTTTNPELLTDNKVKTRPSSNNVKTEKPVESANQHHQGIIKESFGLHNQPATVQSKAQLATSTAATLTGGSDSKQVVASMVSAGRPNTVEPVTTDRVKDKFINDKQKNSRQLNDGLTPGKLNIETVETTAVQNNVTNSNYGIGQITTANSSNSNQQGTTAANTTVADTASAIREQIYESMQTAIQQGSQKITIHLNPPELGRVSVKFSQQGGEITGLLEANNPRTRAEISQSIPEIIRSLEESGITVKQIDVTLSDNSGRHGQETFKENSSQTQWEQFNNHSFQDADWNRPTRDAFVTPAYHTDSQESFSATSQSTSSDKLLDVLI